MKKHLLSLRSITLLAMLTMFSVMSWAQDVLVQSIVLDNPPTQMNTDEMLYVPITLLPENAANKTYSTETSNSQVVIVADQGNSIMLYAIGAGKATIKVKAEDGSGVTTSFDVDVIANASDLLTEIHADPKDVTFTEGDEAYVNVTYAPLDARNMYDIIPSSDLITVSHPSLEFGVSDYSKLIIRSYKKGKYQIVLKAKFVEDVTETINVTVVSKYKEEDKDDENVPEIRLEANLAAPDKQYIDLDFSDQNINISNLNLQDNEAVTDFLKTYVPVMSHFIFQRYRQNTDIKGFTHIDYKQIDPEKMLPVDGSELTIHHDNNGKLWFITGNVAPEPTEKIISVLERKLPSEANFDPYCSSYTEKAELSGNLYTYPKDVITATKTFTGATDGKGNYVLQDPGRVYTLDYTGVSGDYAKEHPSLAGILAAGTNFDSKTAEFSTGYKTMKSQIDRISLPAMGMDESTPLTIEIRKCTIDGNGNGDGEIENEAKAMDDWDGSQNEGEGADGWDDSQNEPQAADGWDAGTTIATSAGNIKNDSINFDFDNLTFEIKGRNQDNVMETMTTYYLAKIKSGEMEMDNFLLPVQHLDCDTIKLMNGEMNAIIRRHLLERQPALDIHWALERVLDVYKETFDIDSYDNQGSPVIALINQSDGISTNACFTQVITDDRCAIMTFALGGFNPLEEESKKMNIAGFYPLTQIETIGHEFTHAVAGKLSSFVGESPALNESYADIMGAMVRRKVLNYSSTYNIMGEPVNYVDWTIGGIGMAGAADICMRRFDDPEKSFDNDPKFYKGEVWNAEDIEAHRNAGVQNHWFYLLCSGGDVTPEVGDPVSITPISRDDAELISFSALMYFAFKNTDYPMARRHSIHAAQMYFGNDSQQLKSVYNAWYAVGVGQEEWQPGMPLSINAINNNNITNTGIRKILKNGQIVIVKNGVEYNVSGQRLK